MEISYSKVGDYDLPNLVLPEEEQSIGKYGRMHKRYLKSEFYAHRSTEEYNQPFLMQRHLKTVDFSGVSGAYVRRIVPDRKGHFKTLSVSPR